MSATGPTERKHVSVLFADLTGSMELAETIDAEDWHLIMERYFQILCDGVDRFEGTVDKFTGDGIMALFGAPIAHEDHARRACFAALHLREELARFSEEFARERGRPFPVRIGINSGEVIVGTIADDRRMEYTAIGSTVGLASRVEALAEPGEAYITEHTAALVEGYVELRDLGRFDVKGVSQPVGVFAVVGRGPLRSAIDVAAARGFSPFVGRDPEMAVLEAALAAAQKGEGSAIGLVAEPGVGKSRLCYEFDLRCRAQGLDVWKAQALVHARAVPFMTALELLRNVFAIDESDTEDDARAKVVRHLRGLDESFDEGLPLLLDFLGIADPNRPVERMDPDARRRQLFATVNRVMRLQSQLAPCVIVVDDLHWSDSASDDLLRALIDGVAGTRILMVANYRPEYPADWRQLEHCRQVELSPLGTDATRQLLEQILGRHPSLDGLSELIAERTGGNPFFIEEVVRSLAESGSLDGGPGGYQLVHTLDEVRIPDTVRSVLAARIDRLSPQAKELLQLASVIGHTFSRRLLGAVATVSEGELAASVHTLLTARFIDQPVGDPEPEYAFRHPLTEEVAYRTQLGERRTRLHRAVAEAITELQPERLDERAALIAHHWESAGDALQAAQWSARAANWAGFNDPALATLHWRKVRSLTAGLTQSPEVIQLGLTAAVMVLTLGWRLGGSTSDDGRQAFEDEAIQIYAEGRRLAESAEGQEAMLAALVVAYATVRGLTGHVDEFQLTLESIDLADRIGDVGFRVAMRAATTYPRFAAGELADGLRIAEEGIELSSGDPSLGAGIAYACPYAALVMVRAVLLGGLGHLNEGFTDVERSILIAREANDLDVQGWAHAVWPWLTHWAGGDGDVALAHARRGVEFTERTGAAFSRAVAYTFLAEAHLLCMAWEEAQAACARALAIMHGCHIGLDFEPLVHTRIARAHLGAGHAAVARPAAETGLRLSRERGHRIAEVEALNTMAQVLLAEDSPDMGAISGHLDAALELIRRTGFASYEPHIHVRMAELTRLGGDEAAAQRQLEIAHRLFTQIGADGWASRLLAAPESA